MPVGALRVFPQLFSSVVVNPVHTLVAIGRDFLEEIGVEVLRRCINEETHHKPREQYVLALGHITCGRGGSEM